MSGNVVPLLTLSDSPKSDQPDPYPQLRFYRMQIFVKTGRGQTFILEVNFSETTSREKEGSFLEIAWRNVAFSVTFGIEEQQRPLLLLEIEPP